MWEVMDMFMFLKGDDVMGIDFSSNSTNYTQFKHTVKKKKRKATKPDKSLLSIVLIFSTLLIT